MAKRTRKPKDEPMPARTEAPPKLMPFSYRPSDPLILQQLEAMADREDRPSINNAINALVLEGLRKRGLWPPPGEGG